MKRSLILFLSDILQNIAYVETFSKGLTKEKLEKNKMKESALVRCLEVIGEAVKNIPQPFRDKYPEVQWKKIAGFRDVIIHAYFQVDLDITWRIIQKDIPILKKQIQKIKDLEENTKNSKI
ncbi:MAG: DUF86 domain-containing protein [Nanoarchaeota archaeon]|nr:DUF86 domain-containing protein [Nanoarchaeota archaeon]MBU1622167.1 DUF86 domain-containing protein [Nanoarchaeota archaeon]MBU1974682.1 DUF86 domain-containing protein [Nanoarchaeota archaeon]